MFSNDEKICLKHKKELIIEPEDFDLDTGHSFCPKCLDEAKIPFLYIRDTFHGTCYYTPQYPLGVLES